MTSVVSCGRPRLAREGKFFIGRGNIFSSSCPASSSSSSSVSLLQQCRYCQAVYTDKTAIFPHTKVTLPQQPPRDPLSFLRLPLRIYSPRVAVSCISHNRGCSRDAANRDQFGKLPPSSPCNWSNGFKMKDAVGSLSCLFGFAGVRMRFNGSAHQMLSDPCE